MYDYGRCHVCGAKMKSSRIKQEFWIKKKLIVIENVPAGVCPQCGEKIVQADVGLRVAAVLKQAKTIRKAKTMTVPVLAYAEDVA
jgi:YgiT-type zinc finger domain-containing protein